MPGPAEIGGRVANRRSIKVELRRLDREGNLRQLCHLAVARRIGRQGVESGFVIPPGPTPTWPVDGTCEDPLAADLQVDTTLGIYIARHEAYFRALALLRRLPRCGLSRFVCRGLVRLTSAGASGTAGTARAERAVVLSRFPRGRFSSLMSRGLVRLEGARRRR